MRRGEDDLQRQSRIELMRMNELTHATRSREQWSGVMVDRGEGGWIDD